MSAVFAGVMVIGLVMLAWFTSDIPTLKVILTITLIIWGALHLGGSLGLTL